MTDFEALKKKCYVNTGEPVDDVLTPPEAENLVDEALRLGFEAGKVEGARDTAEKIFAELEQSMLLEFDELKSRFLGEDKEEKEVKD